MPEVSEDATLLIAASWQALGRVASGDPATLVCDCTIVLVFAGFYIEANLNHIVATLDREGKLAELLRPKSPGLQQKLAWFYLKCVDRMDVTEMHQLGDKALLARLRDVFPGFGEIYNFRNDVAHGRIDRTLANPDSVTELRTKAKRIVQKLFEIALDAGHDIPRLVTYQMAVSSEQSTQGTTDAG
ncbi:MAG: hypothetical protein A2Y74_09215 [Actinobacteria bacterium RBG_13_63_9]|nr:MAG: hypothetical protein A2Y74_09215 [Actinobacteria bacterium RBG_13_63_9]